MKKLIGLLCISLLASGAFADAPIPAPAVPAVTPITDTFVADTSKTVADSTRENRTHEKIEETPVAAPASAPTDSSQVDSAVVKKESVADVAVADSATSDSIAHKKQGKKITYAEYEERQKAKQDSILSVTSHHGISFSTGRQYDKHVGEFADDFVWGSNLGIYYFYRNWFNPYVGFQGRVGALYRYSRFKDKSDYGSAPYKGESFDLERVKTSKYHNIALDAPISLHVGGRVARSLFLYGTLTLEVTKSVFERIDVSNEVRFVNPSAELKETLDYADDYPYTNKHKTQGAFDIDDWESSSWVGLGFDFRFIAVEFQALIAANSTKDNHRFQDMFHKDVPTWRLMIDFGAY